MAVLWTSDFSEPSPLKGHCSGESSGWCNAQIVRAAQIQVEPPFARFEVKHGDTYSDYSDARSVLTGPKPALWAVEGDERFARFTVKAPQGIVTRYPKQDELQSWIANPTGGAFLSFGSILFWHHDAAGQIEKGSAPVYIVVSNGKFRLQIVDQVESSPTFSGPLQVLPIADVKPETEQDFVLGAHFSTDRAKGWVQVWDGVGTELVPRTPHTTIRPGLKSSYLSGGIYRRNTIGDPQYVWPADAVKGIAYPSGFVPAKGQKVYPNGDGYPGVLRLGKFKLTTTKEEAMATPTSTGAVPAGTATPSVVTAPAATPDAQVPLSTAKQADWLALLKATRDEAWAQAATLKARGDKIQAQLDAGRT